MSKELFRARTFTSTGPSFKGVGEQFVSVAESFVEVGPSWKNCGQSAGQSSALQADQNFQKAITSQYETVAGENSAILSDLTGGLEKTFAAGPNQEGFSPAELAVMNSQSINNAAAANKNAQAAIGERAGVSGADPGVESGVVQAERASAASSVENNLSNQEANTTLQDYAVGRQNYDNATKALIEAPSALESPVNQAASAVNTSNADTAQQANANAAANSQWEGMLMGVASDATSFFKPVGSGKGSNS